MDNNERFRSTKEVLADLLIEVQEIKTTVRQNKEQTIGAFNRFAEAILTKMDEQTAKMDQQTAELKGVREEVRGLREETKVWQQHEERLRKIEEVIFKRGA